MKQEEKREILKKIYIELMEAWTYKRMTTPEREKWMGVVEWLETCGPLEEMQTFKEIRALMLSNYSSYLAGLGYCGGSWRESEQAAEK